jgi:NAD(P)-dependent dehydrogenase (short-subunit alcohol dehydrogenase family)
MNAQDLIGKTVLVTGASRGIGRAIALALNEAGAQVIAAARPSDDLTALDEVLSDQGTIWAGDATSDDFLLNIQALESLDILVNNLGVNRPEPLVDVSDENLDFVLDMNVRATFRITREAVKKMNSGASVVSITSQMGHIGSPERTVYCMTKHAIEGLTKAMAVELAPKGIRVNSVAPTFVETPLTKPMLSDPKFMEFVKDMIPMGRIAEVEDVAEAVLYLCQAKMVTGHSLLVDGGWTAR